MPQLRVHSIAMSLDGYAAGPAQDREHPLGVGGNRLHTWAFATRSQRKLLGLDGGEIGPDDEFIARGDDNVGATIMGRNMFGPIRGEWGDEDWRGWWGPEQPYHHPRVRADPPPARADRDGRRHHIPLRRRRHRVGARAGVRRRGRRGCPHRGGPATIQQYLRAGLVGCMHVAVVPTLLGGGERLFVDDLGAPGCEVTEHVPTPPVTHVVLARKGG